MRLPKVILPGDEDKAEPRSDKDFSLAIDWIRVRQGLTVQCKRGIAEPTICLTNRQHSEGLEALFLVFWYQALTEFLLRASS